jgi:hypothetical protein
MSDEKQWTEYQRSVDFLRLRKRAYETAFPDQKTNTVLKDLAEFCRANQSCFHADARLHAVAEGRREVWLRIMNHLNLQPDELYDIYNPTSQTQLKGK